MSPLLSEKLKEGHECAKYGPTQLISTSFETCFTGSLSAKLDPHGGRPPK